MFLQTFLKTDARKNSIIALHIVYHEKRDCLNVSMVWILMKYRIERILKA